MNYCECVIFLAPCSASPISSKNACLLFKPEYLADLHLCKRMHFILTRYAWSWLLHIKDGKAWWWCKIHVSEWPDLNQSGLIQPVPVSFLQAQTCTSMCPSQHGNRVFLNKIKDKNYGWKPAEWILLTAWREAMWNHLYNFVTPFPLFTKHKSTHPFGMCISCVSIYCCPLVSAPLLSLRAYWWADLICFFNQFCESWALCRNLLFVSDKVTTQQKLQLFSISAE